MVPFGAWDRKSIRVLGQCTRGLQQREQTNTRLIKTHSVLQVPASNTLKCISKTSACSNSLLALYLMRVSVTRTSWTAAVLSTLASLLVICGRSSESSELLSESLPAVLLLPAESNVRGCSGALLSNDLPAA